MKARIINRPIGQRTTAEPPEELLEALRKAYEWPMVATSPPTVETPAVPVTGTKASRVGSPSVLYDRPVRELLVEAVSAMPQTFRRQDVVTWFARRYPLVKAGTVAAHITAATVNSRSRHHYPGADQHLLFQRRDGRLELYRRAQHGLWDDYGELVGGAVTPSSPAVTRPDEHMIETAASFEERARSVLGAHLGMNLRSAVVEVAPGVVHQFDLVSADRSVVGDAKYYKNIPVPAAKWSVIAEYVWLLQHLVGAERRFLVFGNDREVPARWLKRFSPLARGVDFYFLGDEDDEVVVLGGG